MLNAGQLLTTTPASTSNSLFQTITNLFAQIGNFLAGSDRAMGLQWVTFISLAIFLTGIAICVILISRTYESRLLKHVAGFNRYFKKNPFINEDNLVEVNQKFKAVPKTLRYCWHEYMLNRDRQPSEYINSVTCIDQPTRSSAYKNISNTVLLITIMVSVFTIIANLICIYAPFMYDDPVAMGQRVNNDMVGLFEILLMPCIYLFTGLFITTFLKLLESSRYADLYYEFHEFERFLNKACSTMPSFVDYEVLFDAKEIRDAIPVLQEYLEKRALQEQKEAEEAELNANHFENFNFEPVGVESALLLDRAMSEGERYFNFKRGLSERINSKETEMFNYQKKFDEVTKEYERKSQAVRENMASINEQLNATSVKIEANYLKKRYNEEQQKQQQLEKDYEYAQANFIKQQQEMEQEVAQMTAEIREKKTQVEENMMSECRNYSNKVWGEINKTIQAQQEPIVKEKEEKARILQEEMDKMTLLVADQDADIKAKQEYIAKLEQDIKVRIAEIEAINNVRDYFNTPEFRQRVSDKKKKRKLEEFEDAQEEKIQEMNSISSIVTTDNRNDKMKQEESELLAKLKETNLANSEYAKDIEAINKRAEEAAANEANPFATFSNLQNNIKEQEKQQKAEEKAKLKAEQEAQAQAEAEAKAAEEAAKAEEEQPAEEAKPEEAPAEEPKAEEAPKKTSLQSLLSSAKKLKK